MSNTVVELFESGKLQAAIAAATEQVKSAPGDIVARSLLAELLCVAGELERAERQFDAIATQDPKTAVRVTELRQIVRANLARQEVLTKGRMPEFLAPPPAHVELRLKALTAIREGNKSEAAALLAEAEEQRPSVVGKIGDRSFDEFRDLDDLFGGVLEVMTTMGKYFWVPMEMIVDASFSKPSRPIDTAWRPVDLTLHDGPSGQVFVPALYPQVGGEEINEALRCGRETEWVEDPAGVVRGSGLRCFLVGDDSMSIFDLGEISFGQQ